MTEVINTLKEKNVSVFFAADDKYLPYLEVAIASLSEHASPSRDYNIYILTTQFSEQSIADIKSIVKPNINVSVCDLTDKIEDVKTQLKLRLRDYYSECIYYRLFIPSLFPELHHALYLDSDVVLLDDVANLYDMPLLGKIIGAVTDESVISVPVFRDYVEGYVGVDSYKRYFNSGVLSIDLDRFREEKIEEKFLYLLKTYNFPTVAPDQDYLNFLCRGKVCYLPPAWNKHAIPGGDELPRERLHLLHFNMFNKPWHYSDVPYEKYFWQYATIVPKAKELFAASRRYTEEMRDADAKAGAKLLETAEDILKNVPPIYKIVHEGFFDGILD